MKNALKPARWLAALGAVPLLVLGGCDRQPAGGKPAAVAEGQPIAISVADEKMDFPHTRLWLRNDENEGKLVRLETDIKQEPRRVVSLTFPTDAKELQDLTGDTLVFDATQSNPKRKYDEEGLDYLRIGEKEYQAYRLKAQVVSASKSAIIMKINGTVLEFPEGTEKPGVERPISSTLTLPLSGPAPTVRKIIP